MKKNKKNKNSKKNKIIIAIIICSVLILCLLLLIVFLNILVKDKQNEETQIITKEEKEEAVTNFVRNKSEKERMQIYLTKYLQHIEREEYSQAYEKLYPQFKENFFPIERDFISYVNTVYSNLIMLEYENIERQGKYYIITAKVTNVGKVETEFIQKFIIYENGFNDYLISFQAKY